MLNLPACTPSLEALLQYVTFYVQCRVQVAPSMTVFDMFRLLYAATQPLPMDVHSRHSALHRLLHVSPVSGPLAPEEIFSLAPEAVACRLGGALRPSSTPAS